VAYNRYDESGGIHVWRVDLDGSRAKALITDAPSQIQDVARNGSVVTFLKLDAEAAVWVMPLDGGAARSLGSRTGMGLISPDGSRILVSQLTRGEGGLERPEFQIVPAGGGAATASFRLPEQADSLAWGPDGDSMTFIDRADPAWNLYRIRLPGGKPEPVTHFTDGRCTSFEWSPDGSRLAVERRIADTSNAWVTATDGSKPVQATHFPNDEIFGLRWSQDGKSVVVSAGKRSSDAVLIRNFR
jgi:Tol biopolymer transport system component